MTESMPTGVYRPCATCGAPVVDPFPEHWHIDLIKEGPRFGPVKTFYTPHADTCGQPMPTYPEDTGITVRIAGHYVTRINIHLPAATPGDPLGLERRTYVHPTHDPDVPVDRESSGDTPVRTYGPNGYLYTRPADAPDWTGRIPLGATTDGIRVTGPLHWLDGVWPVNLDLTDGDVTE